jgi:hypothetical protein
MPSVDRNAPLEKLGLTFHRSFSLSRPSVAQVLALARDGHRISRETLGSRTSLGTIYQEAMPRYARGTGLLDSNHRLTGVGASVAQHDPHLNGLGTQWLMHYHLSAPHGPGPAFWHELVITRFRRGNRFSAAQLTDQVAAFVEATTGKQMLPRSVRSTVTVFLGTYLKPDGLGQLGFLREEDSGQCCVTAPSPPPLWAVAYALIDYWQAHYGGRLTINLSDLFSERGFAPLFMLGQEQLLSLLNDLQEEGVVELYRVAPPYQVVLVQPDLDLALRRLYQR